MSLSRTKSRLKDEKAERILDVAFVHSWPKAQSNLITEDKTWKYHYSPERTKGKRKDKAMNSRRGIG